MTAVQILIALLLVAANGFFVAVEFALTRLRPTQAEELREQGRPGAKSAYHAATHLDRYLAACQLGITVSSIGLGMAGESALHHLLEPVIGDARVLSMGIAGALSFLIITMLHVVLGELTPKGLALSKTVPVALMLAPLMRVFYLGTRPVVNLFNGMGNGLLALFNVPAPSEARHPHSESELRRLLQESEEEGMIEEDEREMAERAMLYADRRVKEIMTPRPEVVSVSAAQNVREVAEIAARTGRSRIPLCPHEGALEEALGVLHMKDLLQAATSGQVDCEVATLVRPLPRINESVHIDELLRQLRLERQHLALVLDEHGTAVGLVSLEDVLEEIVGEIEDEFDVDGEPEVASDGNGGLLVDGQASTREIFDRLDLDEPEHDGTTLNGFVQDELGRLPDTGETVQIGPLLIKVLDIGPAQLLRAQVKRLPQDS